MPITFKIASSLSNQARFGDFGGRPVITYRDLDAPRENDDYF